MKILISIGSLGLGGAEKQAVWLANRLSEFHEVSLLTYHGGTREKDLRPQVSWSTIFDNQTEHTDEKFTDVIAGQVTKEITSDPTCLLQKVNPILNSGSLISRPKAFKGYLIENLRKKHTIFQIVKQFYNILRLQYFKNQIQYFKNQTFIFRKSRKALKRFQPDLVITFLFGDTLNIGFAAITQVYRPKLIVGRRSPVGYGDDSRSWISKLILRIVYLFSDLAVSNSVSNIESALQEGLSKRKIRIIGNYITPNKLSEITFTKNKVLEVLCIANFHRYKNHEGLLRAVYSIPGHERMFHFTFVGDGPLLGDSQKLAVDLKISAEFKGFLYNPSSEIHCYHALVLVSHHEGSSNALLEGLAAGVPALVSRVGDAQELVKQGAPLILCDSLDLDSIADGLNKLRDEYHEIRIEAKNFARFLMQTLDEDSVLKKWQGVIKEVTFS